MGEGVEFVLIVLAGACLIAMIVLLWRMLPWS